MVLQHFDGADMDRNRWTGGLGYVIFFLPLICCNNSRFGRYCANQGLLLTITGLAVAAVLSLISWLLGWIPLLGAIITFIVNLARKIVLLALFCAAAYFATKAIRDREVLEVPFIGKYTIIR